MAGIVGVIPARYGSKRLPAKALLPLQGKPLLFYVWRTAKRAKSINRLVIATDSDIIAATAEEFGAEVIRTSARAKNGTERTAEVARKIRGRLYVNIQGDNFAFSPSWIDAGVKALSASRKFDLFTLATAIDSDDELFNPARVKVALSGSGAQRQALWFSRYPIPFLRGPKKGARWRQFRFYKHIGVYFYRAQALKRYMTWPVGTHEKAESLEQLRALEQGEPIGVRLVRGKSIVIDSKEDIRAASGLL